AARGEVFYADDQTPRSFAPIVFGLASGSCSELSSGTTVPIVDGSCAPYTLPGPSGGINQVAGPSLSLLDSASQVVATSSTSVGYVLPLDPLDVTAPAASVVGQAYSIAASNQAGVPVGWQVSISPTGAAGSALTASTSWTKAGSFSV